MFHWQERGKKSLRFHLCGADVAGGFVSADVLLSGLQSQSKHLLPSCISEVEICIFKDDLTVTEMPVWAENSFERQVLALLYPTVAAWALPLCEGLTLA